MAQTQQPPRDLAAPRGTPPRGEADGEDRVVARVINPFNSRTPGTGLVSVEQQRVIAEVQARMIVARSMPRDASHSMDMIVNDCTRIGLAEAATYNYSRGGTDIAGPTIRLMEAIASRWGNIQAGIKEVSRQGDRSECVAYAWDLESGYYEERQFQIRHWRDRRSGGQQLTDERDIYELIANFGQRRKRAALQAVIPGDVIEAALSQCEQTLVQKADVTPEGLKKMVDAFAEIGVVRTQIEKRIQCRIEAIRPGQLVRLRAIYNSIKDGMSVPTDWFDPAAPVDAAKQEQQPQQRAEDWGQQTDPADQTADAGTNADQQDAPTGTEQQPAEPGGATRETVATTSPRVRTSRRVSPDFPNM